MCYEGSTVSTHMSLSSYPGQQSCSAGKQPCQIRRKSVGEKRKINIWAESLKQVALLNTPQVVMSQQVFMIDSVNVLWTGWLHLFVTQWASAGTLGMCLKSLPIYYIVRYLYCQSICTAPKKWNKKSSIRACTQSNASCFTDVWTTVLLHNTPSISGDTKWWRVQKCHSVTQ